MDLKVIYKNARCAVLEIEDGGTYETSRMYRLYLNGKFIRETGNAVTSIYDLKPDTSYQVEARSGEGLVLKSSFTTDSEFVTLDVRDFGAKGDGIQDDTLFIQAAIMACPEKSRVLIPAGTYRIVSLFLKEDVNIELAEGAVLSAYTDRTRFPVFQGMIQSYDEQGEYNLGTWEGNPLPMFTGIINGVNVKGAVIYGQGTIDGNAGDSEGNWWHEPKVIHTACRPRMIFLERCRQVTVQGITVRNSPSWNIHPYFSDDLRFLNLTLRC